jgi:membrane-associated phospholipid phosphatase
VEPLEGRLLLSGDMVLRWNDALLAALRTAGQSTTPTARFAAIVQAAVYDAVNSIDGTYTPYLAAIPAPPGASEDAAVAQAAHDALVGLFPTQATTLDLELKASLETIPDGDAKTAGIQVGQAAAQNILAARANDGSDKTVDYTPGTNQGDWQPTPPAYGPPIQPQWPSVTPFCLQSGSQFRPPPPPALTSDEYTAAFNLTKDLGSIDSTSRTADQTESALFWEGIATPNSRTVGLWNKIAQEAAIAQGSTLVQNARMLALLDLTFADTALACWDAKYTYNFWRPVTAIRAADTDGNPATEADPNWTPLMATPSHPSYPSAHSTELGGAAVALASFFGTDTIPFSISWEGLPGVTRTFAGFGAAADEASMSRIWAGFHWSFDLTAGRALGQSVAEYIAQNFLLPRTSPSPRSAPSSTHLGVSDLRTDEPFTRTPGAAGSQSPPAAGHHSDAAVVPSSSSSSSDTRETRLSPRQLTVYQGGKGTASNSGTSGSSAWQKAQQPAQSAAADAVFGSADSWEASLDLTP